ncbi:Alpha/Beta hydrolase protein [Suillus spraguei]|nr:Alpha/Beta hydrolase protein [Suillus spraguei]
MSQVAEIQYYHHGRFRVAGGVLPDAITAYQTFGDPKNPVVVFPTCYGGKLDSQSYMVGEDKALDPRKYYVVTLALFSNGESSSPSNTPAPYNGPYFPTVTYEDNVRAQYAVLTKKLGVKKVFCVIGFSMGAQQVNVFVESNDDFTEALQAYYCPHNQCFLEGPKAALSASKDFLDGHYKSTPQHGIRAFGRAYSAWAYSQAWFAKKGYLFDGKYTSLNDFLREDWEGGFLEGWDANDLLTLLNTWQMGDVSLIRDGGYFANCLGAIRARGLIMPCKTDLYFTPEDSQNEMKFLNNAKLVIIDSEWGHMSGGGSNVHDDEFIKEEYYHHGRFKVAGGVLPDAVTAYQTYGDPSNDKVIVFPTCYGAKLALGSQDYLVGEGKALDPNKYFVVTFALFCNGESSSPSNTPAPYGGPYFPFVSYEDNIRAQHAVLTKHLGVRKIFSVVGFSMGGQQAYHWPVVFPDFVERFVSICSSARTSPHNQWAKAAMLASKDFADGHYQSTPQHGIRAFGRVYSAWAYGQTVTSWNFANRYPDLNSFLRERWEGGYVNNWDANDMIALLTTWQKGDISIIRDGGDYEKALKSIKAKGLIMPSKTDLYFPPEDSETEVSHLRDAKLHVIPSIWGHVAGGSANPPDVVFITEKIVEFLQTP